MMMMMMMMMLAIDGSLMGVVPDGPDDVLKQKRDGSLFRQLRFRVIIYCNQFIYLGIEWWIGG